MANTLLDFFTGGRYSTSEDLPTIPEMGHSYIDQLIDANEFIQTQEPQVVGPGGLGMLEWAGGPTKAMGMLIGRKGVQGMLESARKSRVFHRDAVDRITNELSRISSKPTSFPGQRMKEIDALNALLNKASVQHMNYRDITRLLAQYKKLGYATPVPIQKLKK